MTDRTRVSYHERMKHLLSHSALFLFSGKIRFMASALWIEGWVIGLFVIANGIYVVAFPPLNDEPQGYAIIAIGVFIILIARHFDSVQREERSIPPK